MLDCLAGELSCRLSIFGLRAPGLRHRQITQQELAKGRFLGGATRFVIDEEGVVYTDLRVSGSGAED